MAKKTVQQLAQDYVLFGIDFLAFDEIVEMLKAADDLYHNDAESFLTDEQYDVAKRYAESQQPNHSYFLGVGSSVRGGKIKLPYPMGSLTQAYEGDAVRWVAKHQLQRERFIVTEKLDGVSVLIVYGDDGRLQIAYSRGDGTEGADITRHISKIAGVPTRVAERKSLVIRAEAIISKENFIKVQPLVKSRSGQPYKNARNMMAGVMNASENNPVVYDYIDVVAYEILNDKHDKVDALKLLKEENDFKVPEHILITGDRLDDSNLTKILNTMREESQYEIDGVVVELNSASVRQKVNPTKDTLNPEYARKYKVADASNLAIADVIEVEWNISKDGYLKPRVRIEPIELVGVTVQYATGFNAKFIAENKIGPGAKIKITRSGDVIPFILECVEPADDVVLPDGVWTPTGVDLIIKDVQSNDTVKYEQLKDFFATIDVPALKEGNILTLFQAGFTQPEDIIAMTEGELCSLIGKAIGKKIFAGIREKFTNIPMYLLMGAHPAFGRGVGVRKMKKLYEAFQGNMARCFKVADIMSVDGFEHKTATKIANGMQAFDAFYLQVRPYVQVAKYEAPKQGGLSGQTFVFTGFRSSELEAAIEELGGKMGSAVSNKTTFLVADDPNSTSGKAAKARSLGVKVISVDDLKAML